MKRRKDTNYRTTFFDDFDRENEVYRKFNYNPREFRRATQVASKPATSNNSLELSKFQGFEGVPSQINIGYVQPGILERDKRPSDREKRAKLRQTMRKQRELEATRRLSEKIKEDAAIAERIKQYLEAQK